MLLAGRKPSVSHSGLCGQAWGRSVRRALGLAVELSDGAMIEFLIKRGADIDRPSPHLSMAPLSIAALHGDVEVVRLLLQHGAKPQSSARCHACSHKA